MHATSTDEDIVRTERISEGSDSGGNDRRERVIWAAGFLDADGSFGVYIQSPKGEKIRTLVLQAVQVNPEPLRELSRLFGGKVHPRSYGKRRDYYQWVIGGQKAHAALREIGPYLVGKRAEYLVAQEFMVLKEASFGRARDASEQADMEALRQELMRLKHIRF